MTAITGFTDYTGERLLGIDHADESVTFLRSDSVEGYTYDPNTRTLTVDTRAGVRHEWTSTDSTTAELDDVLFKVIARRW